MQTETIAQTVNPELAVIMATLIREEERGAKLALQAIADHADIFAKPVAEAVLSAIMSPLHEWTLVDLPECSKPCWRRELDLIKRELLAIGVAAAGVDPEAPTPPRYGKILAPVDALASARDFRLRVESIAQTARTGMTSAACESLIHASYAAVTGRLPRLSATPLGCDEINARAARIVREGMKALQDALEAQRPAKMRGLN